MRKRILSMALAVCIIAAMLTAPVCAAETGTTDDYTEATVWHYSDFEGFASGADVGVGVPMEGSQYETGFSYDGSGTSVLRIKRDASGIKQHDVWLLGSNTAATSVLSVTGSPVLAVEYRARGHLTNESYFGTTVRSRTVNIGGKNRKNVVWDAAAGNITTVEDQEDWNTYTVVLSNTAAEKTIYVNGNCIGIYPDNTPDAYKYSTSGYKKIYLGFMAYIGITNYVEYDYIKVYTKPEKLTARLANVASRSLVVEFSNAPVNISSNSFSLSDGTVITDIERINETTYKLIVSEKMTEGNNTLIFDDEIKDTVNNTISTASVDFTIEAETEFNDVIPYYEPFDDTLNENTRISPTTNAAESGSSSEINDGKLNINLQDPDALGNVWYDIYSNVNYTNTNEAKPPFVYEYKFKVDKSDNKLNYIGMKKYLGSELRTYSNLIYPKTQKGSGTNFNVKFDTGTQVWSDWHVLSNVYSPDSETTSYYLDGHHIGTYTDNTALEGKAYTGNTYAGENGNVGEMQMVVYIAASANQNVSLDYIKTYEQPKVFTAVVENAMATEPNEIILDFSGTPLNVSVTNIRVNGEVPEKITCTDEKNQKYKVELAEELKPETEYLVSLNGIYNTTGQTTYDTIAFKTRAVNNGEIYFDISGSGIVETAGGDAINNNTFVNAESISVTVKANKGYDAVVKINGEITEATSYGKYVINASEGVYADIDFVAVPEEEAPAFISVPYAFIEENRCYAFARLNKALEKGTFGVIASKEKIEATLEDVDGEKTLSFPAINGSNKYGEFGIGIIDNSEIKVLGSNFYVRPYATIGDTTVYGTVITVDTTDGEN